MVDAGSSSRWCVASTVAGSSARSSVATSASRDGRSSPAAGSSSSSSSGRPISARASITRARSPWLQVPIVRLASPPHPTSSSRLSAVLRSSSENSVSQDSSAPREPVSTASSTVISGLIDSLSRWLVWPIRRRRTRTSTEPSRSPSTVTVPETG